MTRGKRASNRAAQAAPAPLVRKATTTNAHPFSVSKTANFDSMMGTAGGLYSAQLSTDFLQKPQNMRERRALWRHFYTFNEFVGAAIDLHSSIPLSRTRLQKPKAKNKHQAEYVYRFFEQMCERLRLFEALKGISHEYWLIGNVFPYAEEHNPYAENLDPHIVDKARLGDETSKAILKEELGMRLERNKARSDKLYNDFDVIDKDPGYLGWDRIVVLPPDQVQVEKQIFNEYPDLTFIPDDRTKAILAGSDPGIDTPVNIPQDLIDATDEKGHIVLSTDPNKGSYCHHIARKKSPYEPLGTSILERCVNTLILGDKLRQSQMMITDRHMTPNRVITSPDLSEDQVEELRDQVDLSLMDPDYSIIANYEITWNEMSSNGRLLELSAEHEHQESSLFAGLGVTRDLLTGESMYAGNKMSMQVLDIQYMSFRDDLKYYVEEYLFKPVARKKGFVEEDEYGNEVLLYPRLSFTRLSIRDNDEYFNQVMQLYTKGSVSVDVVLDILNIDPEDTFAKVKADLFTVNDPTFNQFMSGAYGALGQKLVDNSNIDELVALNIGAAMKPAAEEGGDEAGMRFASTKKPQNTHAQNKVAKLLERLAANPEMLDKLLGALDA